MDALELIRRGYKALGLGADAAVLAMFDQGGAHPARWVVHELIDSGRRYPSREVVAMDLFGGVPPNFELIGVEPRIWRTHERRPRRRRGRETRLVVAGRFRTRVRGDWQTMDLPFTHVWYVVEGRVDRVVSFLDGVEVLRVGAGRRGER